MTSTLMSSYCNIGNLLYCFHGKLTGKSGGLGPDLQVDLTMTAQPARPMTPDEGRSGGLKGVRHVIAVSSCKGGTTRSYTRSQTDASKR